MKNKSIVKTILLAGLALLVATFAHAAPKGDTDGDDALSLEEFVIFVAERDLKQRDRNKDEILTLEEWKGKATKGFRVDTIERFNLDKDNVMSADEIVEVYIWNFQKRDKNKDGKLVGDEIPKYLRAK